MRDLMHYLKVFSVAQVSPLCIHTLVFCYSTCCFLPQKTEPCGMHPSTRFLGLLFAVEFGQQNRGERGRIEKKAKLALGSLPCTALH